MNAYISSMTPLQIIQKLNQAKTDKAKAKIIKIAWQSDCEDFFVGVELSFNLSVNFGLKSAPEIQDVDDGSPGSLSFKEFYQLAVQLSQSQLNPDQITESVTDAAMRANVTEWNEWYRRILLKTLPKYLPMNIIKDTLVELTKQ